MNLAGDMEKIKQSNPAKLEKQALKNGVEADFGVGIAEIKEVDVGFKNQFFRATTASGGEIFIGVNKNKAAMEAEVYGYNLFEKQGIPAPKVVKYQENPPTIGSPAVILSVVEGVNLKEANLSMEQENIVYENAGEILRKINENN